MVLVSEAPLTRLDLADILRAEADRLATVRVKPSGWQALRDSLRNVATKLETGTHMATRGGTNT